MNNSDFKLNDDDVISTDPLLSLCTGPIFKVKDAPQGMTGKLSLDSRGNPSLYTRWLTKEGVKCEVLQVSGRGWLKGKIRFRLEFIPDEPPQVEKKDPFGDM
jgi:KGK domain